MINPKLKQLIKHSAEVLALYQVKNNDDTVEIVTYMDELEKGSEVVTIIFKNVTSFGWEFLEPLSNYCIAKEVSWNIDIQDEQLTITLQ